MSSLGQRARREVIARKKARGGKMYEEKSQMRMSKNDKGKEERRKQNSHSEKEKAKGLVG